MQFIPHNYQSYATNFIVEHPIAALFLDMGLGKTIITLTALEDLLFDSFLSHKVLIIAPLRVARTTWPDEIAKWDHLKDLRFSLIAGSPKQRMEALKTKADLYIINRENVPWLCEQDFDFDTVVIDELSSFKSNKAKRFKALSACRPSIKRMIGLTGTPSSNGLEDLWSEFRLLDGGKRLGRYISHFRDEYLRPDRRNGMVIYSYKPLPGAEEKIYEKISDITISMKAIDHLKMPELISLKKEVEMSPEENDHYQKLKKTLVLELEDQEITAINAASLSGKLAQLASGAIYTEDKEYVEIHQQKLDALEDLIEAANGKPVLIAYWFKHDLERLKSRFTVREIKQEGDIRDWNAGKIPIAAIHPASAGHGLNLQQGGSVLVWFSLTWSLELYQQTNARLYRQGQKELVRIIHLVCKDTIDEDILASLQNKEVSQERLIEAVKARIGGEWSGGQGVLRTDN